MELYMGFCSWLFSLSMYLIFIPAVNICILHLFQPPDSIPWHRYSILTICHLIHFGNVYFDAIVNNVSMDINVYVYVDFTSLRHAGMDLCPGMVNICFTFRGNTKSFFKWIRCYMFSLIRGERKGGNSLFLKLGNTFYKIHFVLCFLWIWKPGNIDNWPWVNTGIISNKLDWEAHLGSMVTWDPW